MVEPIFLAQAVGQVVADVSSATIDRVVAVPLSANSFAVLKAKPSTAPTPSKLWASLWTIAETSGVPVESGITSIDLPSVLGSTMQLEGAINVGPGHGMALLQQGQSYSRYQRFDVDVQINGINSELIDNRALVYLGHDATSTIGTPGSAGTIVKGDYNTNGPPDRQAGVHYYQIYPQSTAVPADSQPWTSGPVSTTFRFQGLLGQTFTAWVGVTNSVDDWISQQQSNEVTPKWFMQLTLSANGSAVGQSVSSGSGPGSLTVTVVATTVVPLLENTKALHSINVVQGGSSLTLTTSELMSEASVHSLVNPADFGNPSFNGHGALGRIPGGDVVAAIGAVGGNREVTLVVVPVGDSGSPSGGARVLGRRNVTFNGAAQTNDYYDLHAVSAGGDHLGLINYDPGSKRYTHLQLTPNGLMSEVAFAGPTTGLAWIRLAGPVLYVHAAGVAVDGLLVRDLMVGSQVAVPSTAMTDYGADSPASSVARLFGEAGDSILVWGPTAGGVRVTEVSRAGVVGAFAESSPASGAVDRYGQLLVLPAPSRFAVVASSIAGAFASAVFVFAMPLGTAPVPLSNLGLGLGVSGARFNRP